MCIPYAVAAGYPYRSLSIEIGSKRAISRRISQLPNQNDVWRTFFSGYTAMSNTAGAGTHGQNLTISRCCFNILLFAAYYTPLMHPNRGEIRRYASFLVTRAPSPNDVELLTRVFALTNFRCRNSCRHHLPKSHQLRARLSISNAKRRNVYVAATSEVLGKNRD